MRARAFQRGLLSLGIYALTFAGATADELRISADDLKVRAAVSQLLAPSLRLQLRDLAAGTPLSMADGVVQTQQILDATFADRNWDADRRTLVRYYFMVARMEKSREFSAEFARRRALTEKGRDLMRAYLDELNSAIFRGVFVKNASVDTGPLRPFPLGEAAWEERDGKKTKLVVLHDYPPVETSLGRETLRVLRAQAGGDLELLESQLSDLDDAERDFIEEISLIGKELLAARPGVVQLVRIPRAGLPFSF